MASQDSVIRAHAALNKKYGEIESYVDPDKFTADLETSESSLSDDMRRQSSLTAYYGVLASKAKRQMSQCKLRVRQTEAKLSKKYKLQLEGEGERPTNPVISAMVATHPLFRAQSERLIDAEEVYEISKVAYDAFKYRREMLTGIGNMKRAEMRSNLNVRQSEDRKQSTSERVANIRNKFRRSSSEEGDESEATEQGEQR